ncbi:MAG: hypothetical protein ACXVNO_03365 [Bacteroidia bacterium]
MKNTATNKKQRTGQLMLCLILLTLLFPAILNAGTGDTLKHKYVSIGIRTTREFVTQVNDPISARFMVAVDPIKYCRVDFQYGRVKSGNDYVYTGYNSVTGNTYTTTYHPTYKAHAITFGAFGMLPLGKSRIYAGYRFETSTYDQEDLGTSGSGPGNPVIFTTTGKGKTHSAVFGGEHFFGNHFSLGAEIAYNISKTNMTSNRPQTPATMSDLTYTDASVIFRFYLY